MVADFRPSAGRTLFTFLILGPPLGGLTLMAIYFASAEAAGNPPVDWRGIAIVLTGSYLVGGLAALATGLLATALRRRLAASLTYIAVATIIGGCLSAMTMFVLSLLISEPSAWTGTAQVAAAGALAALVCAMLTRSRSGLAPA